MKLIGFTTDEIAGIFTLLGGILHLGNVLFKDLFIDGMDSVDVLNEKGTLRLLSFHCYPQSKEMLVSYGYFFNELAGKGYLNRLLCGSPK